MLFETLNNYKLVLNEMWEKMSWNVVETTKTQKIRDKQGKLVLRGRPCYSPVIGYCKKVWLCAHTCLVSLTHFGLVILSNLKKLLNNWQDMGSWSPTPCWDANFWFLGERELYFSCSRSWSCIHAHTSTTNCTQSVSGIRRVMELREKVVER